MYLDEARSARLCWDAPIIGAMHLYHMLAFRIDSHDLFHHLLFIPFNQVSVELPRWIGGWAWGPCIQMQHFFVCGLPGAIDYGCLCLCRAGHMSVKKQKRIQTVLNLWLRCPGILFTISVLVLETVRKSVPFAAIAVVLADASLIGFNCLYYTDRVIRSHERRVM